MNEIIALDLVEAAVKEIVSTLKRVRAKNIQIADTGLMIEGAPAPIQVTFAWGPSGNFPFVIGSSDADEFQIIGTVYIDRDVEAKNVLDKITETEKNEILRKIQYAVMQHAVGYNPIKPHPPMMPYSGWSISSSIWHIDDPQFMHDKIMKVVSAQSVAMSIFQDELLRLKQAFEVEKKIEG